MYSVRKQVIAKNFTNVEHSQVLEILSDVS